MTAYTINHYNGSSLVTVADGTANSSATSLTLIGHALANYGTFLNENFVYLLENFSNGPSNPPLNPTQGQLWWDSTAKVLNGYTGANWLTLSGQVANLTVNSSITVGNVVTTNGIYYANGLAFSSSSYTNSNVASYLPTYTGTFGTLTSLNVSGTASATNVYAGTIGNTGAVITGATLTLSSYAQATNFYDATGNYNVNLGSGGTAGRGVVAGYSNGSYGSIGYNLLTRIISHKMTKLQCYVLIAVV
jgi:hypothetical protein